LQDLDLHHLHQMEENVTLLDKELQLPCSFCHYLKYYHHYYCLQDAEAVFPVIVEEEIVEVKVGTAVVVFV
jgi:hypothetical protein